MNVIILIESIDQLNFFKKFKNYFQRTNKNSIVITDKLSIYLAVKTDLLFEVILLKKQKIQDNIPDLNSTVEVVKNQFSRHKCELIYSSVCLSADALIKNCKNLVFFVWGGNTIAATAIKNTAKINSIDVLFFDYGNYDNRIFIDPCGINIDSYVYNNFELVLKNYETKTAISDLKILVKTGNKKNKINLNFYFFLDLIFSWVRGLPFRGEKNPLKKIHYLAKKMLHKQRTKTLITDKFYFIAFAHSYEINKLNLKIPNVIKQLEVIIDEARLNNLVVLAKFHPDETDDIFMRSIFRLEKQKNFSIVDYDAVELIEKAERVYLYNTSLAITAILHGKEIFFMCKSFYDKFDKNSLIYFLKYYLLDLKIDSCNNFLDASVNAIFKRLEITQNNKIE